MPPSPPQLTGRVHIRDDREDLFDDLGMNLLQAATQAVEQRGIFHLALSGGSTPERFYMRLVIDPRFRALPWSETHLWLVDERRVPLDDELSNFRMIRESLSEHVPLPRRQIHPLPVSEESPAEIYEQELRDAFSQPQGTPRLDFVLLGMGDDGHTASLFPHSPALNERDRLIVVNEGDNVTPPPRLTMTYPLLNAARELAVLVTGEKKAEAIQHIAHQLNTTPDPAALPILGINPLTTQHATPDTPSPLTWYLDSAAATPK